MTGMDMGGFLPLILIFVVMYFLIIRPQNKKAKQHREMIANLSKGARVVMNGGMIGTVTKVLDQELVLEVAKGVEMHVSRPMVATVLTADAPKAAEVKAVEKKESATKAPAKKAPAKKPAAKGKTTAKK